MVLRKITVHISVRYISESEQTKEKEVKQKTMKNNSNPKKQIEIISQNIKKSLKILQHKDSNILKEK